MTRKHRYEVYGLSVVSELRLPELAACSSGGQADVEVRLESLPTSGPGFVAYEGGVRFTIGGTGTFAVEHGRKILVDPEPGAPRRNLRLYLLGSAFGALLHQRGLLPLHANALVTDRGAVLFMGHSGAGKSTLAAWLHDRGLGLLSDDVCVVSAGEGQNALAYPGVPRLRLWRDALTRSGRDASAYRSSYGGLDKYDVPLEARVARRPVPVDRIFLLARSDEGSAAVEWRRLGGVAAVEALVANTYRGSYVEHVGRTAGHLAQCLRLARSVPVLELQRPWSARRIEEVNERVLDLVLSRATA